MAKRTRVLIQLTVNPLNIITDTTDCIQDKWCVNVSELGSCHLSFIQQMETHVTAKKLQNLCQQENYFYTSARFSLATNRSQLLI